MNKKTRNIIIFSFSVVLCLGLYGIMMFGLADFNDPNNTSGLRFDADNIDYTRPAEYPFADLTNSTQRDLGRAVGAFLWETRAIDIILVGVMLLVASESAATVIKGIEDQKYEFRAEMCDTDKFIVLEEKAAEQSEEAK